MHSYGDPRIDRPEGPRLPHCKRAEPFIKEKNDEEPTQSAPSELLANRIALARNGNGSYCLPSKMQSICISSCRIRILRRKVAQAKRSYSRGFENSSTTLMLLIGGLVLARELPPDVRRKFFENVRCHVDADLRSQ